MDFFASGDYWDDGSPFQKYWRKYIVKDDPSSFPVAIARYLSSLLTEVSETQLARSVWFPYAKT